MRKEISFVFKTEMRFGILATLACMKHNSKHCYIDAFYIKILYVYIIWKKNIVSTFIIMSHELEKYILSR